MICTVSRTPTVGWRYRNRRYAVRGGADSVSVAFWALVGLGTLTCLFMAWALGANSNSPPFAPAIGANAISTMRAAFLIGILAALGALT